MEWQVREAADAWNPMGLTQMTPGRFASNPFPGLVHQRSYCLRVRFVDAQGPGAWGPAGGATCGVDAGDLCFTWDSAPPSAPTLVDGGMVPGTNRVEVVLAPSVDDGDGVGRYTLRYLSSNAAAQFGFGSSSTTFVHDIIGAGTWQLAAFAEDVAGNISANSGSVWVTAGFDASIPPPPPPTWVVPLTNEAFVDLTWPGDGVTESWLLTSRLLDGGWGASTRPRTGALSALIGVGGPCRRHEARLARVIGNQASDWSAPSPQLLVDTVAPVVEPPTLLGVDGGVALLTWAPALDACPSGLTYRLERTVDGRTWVVRQTLSETEAADVLDQLGVLMWRVAAIDGAGNVGISDAGAALAAMPAPDAGEGDAGLPDGGGPDGGGPDGGEPDGGEPDGGEPDAGPMDAGSDAGLDDAGVEVPDAGARSEQSFAVGCACDTAPAAEWWALAAWVTGVRLRRRVDPARRAAASGRARLAGNG
jgi:hypothetical protein